MNKASRCDGIPVDLFQILKDDAINSVGEGEGGMLLENGIETCIISYVKQITSPGLMHDTGFSGLLHWDDPEGWGTHVHSWWILVNVWYGKTNTIL